MPDIFVYGTPARVSQERLEGYAKGLIKIVRESGDPVIGEGEEVVVFFIPDRMKWDLGKEIAVRIKDYRCTVPESTNIRGNFIREVLSCTQLFFPKAAYVKVVAKPLNGAAEMCHTV